MSVSEPSIRGRHTEVDVTKGTGTDLAADAVLVADTEVLRAVC
jgi:hypothetical protein